LILVAPSGALWVFPLLTFELAGSANSAMSSPR
jgi:hypothetical protein